MAKFGGEVISFAGLGRQWARIKNPGFSTSLKLTNF